LGGSGTLTNSGSLRLNASHTLSGVYTQAPEGTLIIGVSNASTYGQLIVSGTSTMTDSNVRIVQAGGTSLYQGESFYWCRQQALAPTIAVLM